MDLNAIVSGAIGAVNAPTSITWQKYLSSTTDAAGVTTPTYATAVTLAAQVQPLSTDKLAHLANLNIQGVLRSVYVEGALLTAVRVDGTGGDLLQFPEVPGGPMRTWLVEIVDEPWPNWCRATVRLQND